MMLSYFRYHRNRDRQLTREKMKELKEIGFSFSAKSTKAQFIVENANRIVREENDWLHNYSKLLEYKAKHGHTLVPKIFPENPTLSSWYVVEYIFIVIGVDNIS
jgi:hypothetical protein